MTCARREAGAHRPAASTPAGSARPDPRSGRRGARLFLLLPVVALLLGALGLFAAAPAQAQTTVWSATLTVDYASSRDGSPAYGCDNGSSGGPALDNCSTSTVLTDDDFDYPTGGTTYTIDRLNHNAGGTPLYLGFSGVTAAAAKTALTGLTLTVGSGMSAKAFAIADATAPSTSGSALSWSSAGLSWSDGDTVSLSLTAPAAAKPAKPAGLTATAGNAKVDLSWTDPSDSSITKYRYRQKEGSKAWGSWTDIPSSSATTTSYTVTGLKNGTAYRFRIRAVNAAGEGPQSAVAEATPAAATTTTPTPSGAVWSATLTVQATSNYGGCTACSTRLTQDKFTHGGIEYTITNITLYFGGEISITTNKNGAYTALSGLTLTVGSGPTAKTFRGSDATSVNNGRGLRWSNSQGLSWSANDMVALRLTAPATNSAATGKPSITGTATVGQTLTAAKGTIADANGVTKADNGDAGFAYTYQWIRVDSDGSSNPANISGATSSTYTLASADQGKKVKVKLSFKDDAGNAESRTSDAYPASGTVAAAATTPTPSGGIWSATLTVDHASIFAGCGTSEGLDDCATTTVLSEDQFTHGEPEQTFTITSLHRSNSGTGSLYFQFSGLTGAQAKTALSALTLTVTKGGTSTTLKVSEATTSSNELEWASFSGARWGDGDTVSLQLNAPAAAKPAKPTGLTATAGDKQVALSWTDPSDSSITKYQVQQKAGSAAWGSWTDVPSSSATTTSYTVTGLMNGTAYRFRIRAVNATGNSPQSAVAGPATPAASDTTAPTVTVGSTGYYSDAGATTALTGAQKAGADIYTKVTFSEDMKHVKSDAAAARPELSYRIGSTDTQYHILDSGDTLASGDCKPEDSTSTDVYICRYTVGSSDSGAFTVKAGTNSVDEAGNALAAVYTHAATLTLDNTAPTVTSAATGFYSDAALSNALSGTVKLGADIYAKVTFSEDMKHAKGETDGLPEISVVLSGTTAQRLHIVDSGDTPAALDCKPNHATRTNVYACFVATVSTRDIEGTGVGLRVGTDSVDKAGNALASVYDHASSLTIDNRGPSVEFPSDAPTVGTAAAITLTDATSKVAKYGIVEVDGAATNAEGCDDPSASGDNFSTTAVSPAVSPKEVSHTPVTAGKKICVYAEDAAGNSHAELWSTAIAAANVAPAFSSDATFSVAENETAVGTVAAADADSADSVTYAITGGADRAKFAIVADTGVLTFAAAPDFEDPQDAASTNPSNAAENNEYVLVVTATGGSGARAKTAEQTIVVTVTNVDEAGSVTFGSTTPTVGEALTASVEDPDGGVTSVTWQWAKSSTKGGTYADISGATSASYTPAAGDAGAWLRATAGYTDAEGTGKSANAVAAAAVAAATTTTPTPSGGIWSATLTVAVASADAGCSGSTTACSTQLTNDKFTHGGTEYTITEVILGSSSLTFSTNKTGARTALSGLTLTVGSGATAKTFKVSDAVLLTGDTGFYWTDIQGLSWSSGDTVSLQLTAPAAAKPAKPTGLTATAGDKQVALSWTDPSDSSITKYQVQQKAGTAAWGSWTDIPSSSATTTSYTVTGLMNGTAYRFRIRAVNAAGEGPQSAVAGPATPAASDTTAPTVTAGSTGYYSDAVAATALAGPLKSGADIYTKVTFSEDMKHVKSDAAAARPELFRRIGTTDTQYHILDSGDTLASGDCRPEDSTSTDVYVCFYTVGSSDSGAFTVKAGTNSVDEAGNALAAVYTHAATLTLDTTAPAAPVSLAAEAGDAKVTLTWSDPSPADATISKWQHRQKDSGSYGEWQDVTGGASARRVEVGSLSNGTAYTFQVRAVDTAANEGAAGTTDEVTPAAADNTAPTVTSGSTGYYSDAAAATALTGPLKSGADIYTKVTFSEDMKHVKSDAAAARPELSYRIGTTDTQYHILDSGDTLASGDCKPEDSTSTDVYVCFYTVGSSDDGAFTVKAGTNSVDEAGNALGAAYTHAATLALDTTDPGIAWPSSWAPKTGVAGTIVLTDSNAKIAKYGAIPVVGTSTDATACDTAAEIGTGNLTTLTTPSASVNFEYTPPADSATKKVCAYAEDAAGNSHALLYGTAIAQSVPGQPTGLKATAGDAQVDLAWTDPSDSTITKYQLAYKKKSATGTASFADITGSGATTTSHTVTGLDNGDVYQFWLRAVNSAGNGTHAGPVEATPASSDTTGPSITAIAISSSPDANTESQYAIGKTIAVTATFDEAIVVTGTPTLKIKVGTAEKSASCARKGSTGDDAKKLVCSYTVAEGDLDADGIAVEAGKLAGTIKDAADNAATLTYTAIAAQSGHKVDGVKPTISRIVFNSTATIWTAGTAPTIWVVFSESVDVTGAPTLAAKIGSATRTYTYSPTGSGGGDLNFSYTLQAGDEDSDGVSVDAGSLTLPSDASIKDGAGNDATVTHGGMAAQADFKVDAVKPAIEFPGTGPRVGAASRIVLTDTTAKVKKHGAIVVAAAATDATGCDAASELGSNLTTLATAASPANLDFTPPADSTGKKVCVYAEDAAGNSHAALWSTAIAAATTTTPSGGIWSATLTVQASSASGGCNSSTCPTALTQDKFTYGGIEYTIETITLFPGGSLFFWTNKSGAHTALSGLTLTVGSGPTAKTFKVSDASPRTGGKGFYWTNNQGLSWSANDTVALKLTATAANSAATGKPSITGTATVGRTLTAAKGTVADTNGVTKADNGDAGFAYTYQWIRVDSDGSSNPANIPGATSSTYTLAAADRGKKVKVKLSFQDDAGNAESRTSDAYPASGTVAAATTTTPGAVWSAMLTVGHASGTAGCGRSGLPGCATSSVLSQNSFTHGGVTYTIAQLYRYAVGDPGAGWLILRFSGLTAAQVKTALSGLTLTVTGGGTDTVLQVSEATADGNDLEWFAFSGARWGDGDTVTLSLAGTATTPAVPPSGPNKLVGNVRQAAGPITVPFKWDAAQSFTTGRHPGGYRLTHVDIAITDASPSAPTYSVTIHAPRSSDPNSRKGGLPGAALATLTNPGSLPTRAGEVARFTASGGIELAPRSRYFVVIDVTGAGDRRVKVATVAAVGGRYVYSAATAPQAPLDGDSVANWSIGNVAWRRAAGSGGSWTKKIPRPRLQMAVYGTAKAAPQPVAAMVPAGAIWSSSLTVGRLSNFRPWYGCGNWHERFDKCPVALSDDDLTHGGAAYKFHGVGWYAKSFEERLELILRGPSGEAARAALGSLTLHVDGKAFALGDARVDFTDGFVWFSWPWEGRWREEQLVSLALTAPGTPSGAPAAPPPALEWARVNGAELALRFDKALDESQAPAASAFSVAVAGAARAVSSVAVSGDLVTLTLASAVSSGEAVTVGYAPPAEGPALRLSGGGAAVAAFAGQAVANDTPARQVQAGLTASVASAPAEHRGTGGFEVRIAFSEAVAGRAKDAAIQVSGGTLARAVRVNKRKDLWALTVNPSGYEAVTVTLPATADCAAAGAVCTADGRRLATALTHTIQGPPALSVADARAKEGEDATLDFAVALSRAASGEVTVTYATRDGTAKKGKDYRQAKGTLVFAAGETSKTVSVALLDDAHDEGEETFKLVLKKATGAVIADGEAVGTIENADPLQQDWLARFGRAAAADAVAAVTARLETPREAGSYLTLAGQRVNLSDTDGNAALGQALTGFAQLLGGPCGAGPEADPDGWAGRGATRDGAGAAACPAPRLTGRALLLGSSFRAVLGGGTGPQWTGWGQGASVSAFSSATPSLSLSGETATGSLGMDYEHGRLLAGFAMTHSLGEGTAEGADRHYAMGSAVTTMLPYARYAFSERLSAWGLAGTGTGRFTLALGEGAVERHGADLSMTLAAMGVRGDLVLPREAGGFALALKADGFWVRTESGAVSAPGVGNLAGAQADVSRLRAVLDGSRSFALAGGGTLAPSVTLGFRHDGGDAETGTGFELGAGLGYADPSRGLDLALRVHGLAAHAADGYDEWGVSGSLRLAPGEAGRGLTASLTPSYGAAPGGPERLWLLPDASALAPNGDAPPSRRLDAEVGYGLAMSGGFTGTPHVGLGLSDTARELRLGWRLSPAVGGGFELHLDAARTESGVDPETEHRVGLGVTARW